MATEIQVYEGDGGRDDTALHQRIAELEAIRQRELYDLRTRISRSLLQVMLRDECTRIALSAQVYSTMDLMLADGDHSDQLRHHAAVLEHMERTIAVIEHTRRSKQTHRRVMLAIAISAVLVALILAWCYLR